MAVAPDFLEPRVGWRVWSVVPDGGGLRLASLVYHTVWPPRAELEARCRRPLAALPWGRMPLHGPPDIDCCCGIHAVATLELALPYLRAPRDPRLPVVARVIGRTSLWGKVVECSDGWRAARAYPEEILVPRPRWRVSLRAVDAEAVAAQLSVYGVPIEVVRWCSPDGCRRS